MTSMVCRLQHQRKSPGRKYEFHIYAYEYVYLLRKPSCRILTNSLLSHVLHRRAMHPRSIHLPKNICNSSASRPLHAVLLPKKSALTHRHTRHKPAQRNDAPNLTHIRRPMLCRKLIDERGKRVEQEVLDHHLQDEDFRSVGTERVAVDTTHSARVTTLSREGMLGGRKMGK
jgi:hypothetical protein